MTMSNFTDEMCILQEELFEVMARPYWLWILYNIFMISIFVVGVAGNLLTCIVIYCDRSMHTATNYYLFNLVISDLLVAFGILLNLHSVSDYPALYEGFGDIACQAHFFLVVVLWNNSILIMTVLAIQRYIAIWHPLKLKRKPVWRRVTKIMGVVWTVAFLEALPEIWTVRLIKIKTFHMCFIMPSTFSKWLNGTLGVVNFVVPLMTMLFVYTMVALKVNMAQRNNSKGKIFNQRNSSRKVNNRVMALTLSFMLCWLPLFSMRMFLIVGNWCDTAWLLKYLDMLFMLTSVNSWFSIVLNPLLFSLMSTKFRKSLKILWYTRIRRQNVTLPNFSPNSGATLTRNDDRDNAF